VPTDPGELDRLRRYYGGLSDDALANAYEQGPAAYRAADIWELIRDLHEARHPNQALAAEPPPPADERSPAPTTQSAELVPVFLTGDAVALALAKAALESEGIPFVTQGEAAQDLIGFGRLPGGFNIAAGPVRIHVDSWDAEHAREVLAGIEPR
jgi:Putative prokaryotic signal transducing protein